MTTGENAIYSKYCSIVVGSGIYGLTMAEQIARIIGKPVLVIEKRNHIGGNVWSEFDSETGIEVHKYGSHIFHTSNDAVWEYINRFAKFNNYQHHVWTLHKEKIYPMPIGLATLSAFYGKTVFPKDAENFIPQISEGVSSRSNLEDKAISLIGEELYNAFIKNYTIKQWQIDPKHLPEEIITRLPVRRNFNTRYFNDKYEGLPIEGYAQMLTNLSSHPNIEIRLETDYFKIKDEIPKDKLIIYTGEVDKFFDYKFGRLEWRTLDFEISKLDMADFQGTSVLNYADLSEKFTRIHEFKHFHPERNHLGEKTIIAKEFSRIAGNSDEPYYPVNTKEDRDKMRDYRRLMESTPNVHFGGRLGSYQYLDMHMAIASALVAFENSIKDILESVE
jgi:UDP-galactopyranose mutase